MRHGCCERPKDSKFAGESQKLSKARSCSIRSCLTPGFLERVLTGFTAQTLAIFTPRLEDLPGQVVLQARAPAPGASPGPAAAQRCLDDEAALIWKGRPLRKSTLRAGVSRPSQSLLGHRYLAKPAALLQPDARPIQLLVLEGFLALGNAGVFCKEPGSKLEILQAMQSLAVSAVAHDEQFMLVGDDASWALQTITLAVWNLMLTA